MFELTPEQRDIKQAAREFAEKEFKDIARGTKEVEKILITRRLLKNYY